jgi:hypothetical protein
MAIPHNPRTLVLPGLNPHETLAGDLRRFYAMGARGGVTQMRRIASIAEAHYVTIAPHNPMGPLATAVNIHFCAAQPNFKILEYKPHARAPWAMDRIFRSTDTWSFALIARAGVSKSTKSPGYRGLYSLGAQDHQEAGRIDRLSLRAVQVFPSLDNQQEA